jgi:hypothetical protein
VEAIHAVYRQELWMNLYQPSVKRVKNDRVGSKLRRVSSPAQTSFERVLASGQGDSRRVAELKKLHSMLDPFELSRSIDRKLESIYALANRRLSPKAITERGATAAGNHSIFNVSTAAVPVTFLTCLTRHCCNYDKSDANSGCNHFVLHSFTAILLRTWCRNFVARKCAPRTRQKKKFSPVTFTKSITRNAHVVSQCKSPSCAVDFSC